MKLTKEQAVMLGGNKKEFTVKVISTVKSGNSNFLVVKGDTGLYANIEVDDEDLKKYSVSGTKIKFKEKLTVDSYVIPKKAASTDTVVPSTNRGCVVPPRSHF